MWRFVVFSALAAVAYYFIDDYSNGCDYDTDIKIDGKVVIITGGNTGIGKESVKDLVQRGAKVYVGCRSLTRCQGAIDDIVQGTGAPKDRMISLELDLSRMASVRQFVTEFRKRESRLDILLNSAGVMLHPFNLTEDGYETTFATNHLGHFLLSHLLVDLLMRSAPSRVVTVSSLAHTGGDIDFNDLNRENHGYFPFLQSTIAYAQSKVANILFASELARRLKGTGVTSVSLHPGTIRTDLARHSIFMQIGLVLVHSFLKDPYHGARTSIYCALDPEIQNHNGGYFSDCSLAQPWSALMDVNDIETSRKLWDVSIDLVKLHSDEIHPKLR